MQATKRGRPLIRHRQVELHARTHTPRDLKSGRYLVLWSKLQEATASTWDQDAYEWSTNGVRWPGHDGPIQIFRHLPDEPEST